MSSVLTVIKNEVNRVELMEVLKERFQDRHVGIDFCGCVVACKDIDGAEVFYEKMTDVIVISDGWSDGIRIEADRITQYIQAAEGVVLELGDNFAISLYEI
jgi:hypothetical protein